MGIEVGGYRVFKCSFCRCW